MRKVKKRCFRMYSAPQIVSFGWAINNQFPAIFLSDLMHIGVRSHSIDVPTMPIHSAHKCANHDFAPH